MNKPGDENIMSGVSNEQLLTDLVLAPYIVKATALISVSRRVGGNQFRHAMATFAILIDYKVTDPVLLKASVIHDLIEDIPYTNVEDIKRIDADSPRVVELVLEVTRMPGEDKTAFLQRILSSGSFRAKLLKVADRISNITDLHVDIYSVNKMKDYLEETEKYVLPMAKEANQDMYRELNDLINIRKGVL